MRVPKVLAVLLFSLSWVAAACLIGWILFERFPPSGVFTTTTILDGKSAFINPFLPSERATVPGAQPDGWIGQRIVGDPTYFTARVPGPYDVVDVRVEFRSINQPLAEIGVVRDAAGNDLEMQPMYSEQLASAEWNPVPGGFVHDGASASRLRDLNPEGLATWSASSSMPLIADPSAEPTTTDVSLRGNHDFYFVPSGGAVDVTFGLQDANRTLGNSIAAIRVFRGDEEIQREVMQTNGSRDTRMGRVFEHRVSVSRATPGVYRVSIQASDDVFIRSVRTTSKHWVVGPRLNFGDVVGYATSSEPGVAWTTSHHLTAETLHAEGIQLVTLGDARVDVRHTHSTYRLDRLDGVRAPVRLVAPKGDIRMIGDGFFAFSPSAFFEPKPKRMTDGTELDAEGIQGVLTPYVLPEELADGWLASTHVFALDPAADRLRFILSAPGVADRNAAIDIRRITIAYRRPPLSLRGWIGLLVRELKNAWHRL